MNVLVCVVWQLDDHLVIPVSVILWFCVAILEKIAKLSLLLLNGQWMHWCW